MGVYSPAKPVGVGRGVCYLLGDVSWLMFWYHFGKGVAGPGKGSLSNVALVASRRAFWPSTHIYRFTLHITCSSQHHF